MGYTTEHRGRGSKVVVPGTGQFPNSTCIRTNQSSEGIRYSAIRTEIIRRQRRNTRTIRHFNIKIKSDKARVKQCRRDVRNSNYHEIRKSLAHIKWNVMTK